MSDYERCAELCEEYGFARQAELLRAAARGELRVFAVCVRSLRDGFLDDEGGVPVALFLDLDDAEREAIRRNVWFFRTINLYAYCEGELSYISGRSDEELERGVSAILGVDYRLPDPDVHEGPLFPADATDRQIQAVLRLFDERFFYVAELVFADGVHPPDSAEPPS